MKKSQFTRFGSILALSMLLSSCGGGAANDAAGIGGSATTLDSSGDVSTSGSSDAPSGNDTGGGASSGGGSVGGSAESTDRYQKVNGEPCITAQPVPECTFERLNGVRIAVTQDPDYNRNGHGSDDMAWVYFRFDGLGEVTFADGSTEIRLTNSFSGWISGNTIGVGTTGSHWENVAGGTYWLGRNGVLYSSNSWGTNFGKAIN